MTAVLMLALLAPPPESLDKVRAEPKPERRSELAIEYAGAAMARARKTVSESGSRAGLEAALKETVEACQLALDALRETGKRPNKLGRQYKRAEMRTRQYVKELTDVALALSLDDRPMAESARDRVQLLHEEFLVGVMSGK
ncbi:MAG: hypothetical protein C0504_09165 [Candidatus Solibacter sp.]|nr:hypothetical protein [Candidatus Solibacter sp.]